MLRYAITDRFLLGAGDTAPLIARCGQLAQSGIDYILIREQLPPHPLPTGQLVTLCRQIAAATQGTQTRILVSSRPDIALAANLAGVHLSARPGELTPAHVRHLLPKAIVTASCHTLADIRRARHAGATAALFAPVFGKTIQGQQVTPAQGLDALEAACRQAGPMPVLALGGITGENTPACLQAGAAGIAAIRLYFTPAASPPPHKP